MIYHTAVKRILAAPTGSDRRAGNRLSLLLHYLGVSDRGFTQVRILGESGKSACSAMLCHALTAFGYRTGALTTPFSHAMTECITVDGKPISMDDFAAYYHRVSLAVTAIRNDLDTLPELTEEENEPQSDVQKALYAYRRSGAPFAPFADELLIACALLCFTECGCQMVILEVPSDDRGGAYHLPTAPLISVVTTTETPAVAEAISTRIDLRTQETVSALQNRESLRRISNRCAAINCRLTVPLKNEFYLADLGANRLRFFYKGMEYTLHSGAYYQSHNLLAVLETLSALKRHGFSTDPETASFQPLFGAAGVPLQFTFVSLSPTVITDFADSEVRLSAFAQSLSYHESLKNKPVTLIAEDSALSDKTIGETFAIHGITVAHIIRAEASSALRTMKPVVKALIPEDILLIVGSRPFVYEIHRAICGLMP